MMRRFLLIGALLLALPVVAQTGASQGSNDCATEWFPDARFISRAMGDGRFLYQVELTNRSRNHGVRYTYSFAQPGTANPAEGLHGYLPPGASIEHALGTGGSNLGAEALRDATSLRCFRL